MRGQLRGELSFSFVRAQAAWRFLIEAKIGFLGKTKELPIGAHFILEHVGPASLRDMSARVQQLISHRQWRKREREGT